MLNNKRELNTATSEGTVVLTAAPVVITFTANAPTPGLTQTVADGTSTGPTRVETGQFMADSNDAQTKMIADIAAIKAFLDI